MNIKTAKERLWKQIIEQKKKGQLLEVVGVGIGKAEVAVLVEKKTAELERKVKALDSGGYRVEIEVTGKIKALYGKGDCIKGGTLTLPVFRGNDLMLLSCNHVICGNTDKETVVPKGANIDDCHGRVIGTLEDWNVLTTCEEDPATGGSTCTKPSNTIDAALVKPRFPEEITGINEVTEIEDPRPSLQVKARGITSGEIPGGVPLTDIRLLVGVRKYTCEFTDCFSVSNFIAEMGDSGALVVTRDTGKAVGTIFAGSSLCSYACKMSNVVNQLGVKLTGTIKPINEIGKDTSRAYGYAGFYWTPTEVDIGEYGLKAIFRGDSGYNACESETKTVTVSADRFEVTVTEGVPTKGCCLTVSHSAFKVPFTDTHAVTIVKPGLDKIAKKVGDTVIFSVEDGLEVGKKYVINVGAEPPYPFDNPALCGGYKITAKTDELVEFGGVKKINVKGFYDVPSWQKWWCNLFDVEEADCNSAWSLAPLHVLYAPRSWSLVMRGTELDGTTPGTPTKWDNLWVGLDCLVFLPVGRFANFSGKGAKLASLVVKDTRVVKWIEITITKKKLLRASAAMTDAQYDEVIRLLDAGMLDDAAKCVDDILKVADEFEIAKKLGSQLDTIVHNSRKATRAETLRSAEIIARESKGLDALILSIKNATHGKDAAGIRKVLKAIYNTDNVGIIDRNLKGLPDDVKRVHNLYRYEHAGFVDTLKQTDSYIPEFANRFDEGVDFLIRDLAKKGEPSNYAKILDVFSETERTAIKTTLESAKALNCKKLIGGIDTMRKWGKTGGAFDGTKAVADDIVDVAKKGSSVEKKACRGIIGDATDIPPNAKDKALIERMHKALKEKEYIPLLKWLDDTVIKETGVSWNKLTSGQKVSTYLRITLKLSRHCFMMFIVEEAHQLFTFSLFAAGETLKGWWTKTPAEKEEAKGFYQKSIDAARAAWLPGVLIDIPFMAICPIMAPAYILVEMGAKHYIDTCQGRLDILAKDIYPFGVDAGVAGFCDIPVRCNVEGAQVICSNAMITKWSCGHTRQLIEDVVVKEEPYECVITAYAEGYIEASKKITINPYDAGRVYKHEVYLELTPETNVIDETGKNTLPPVDPPTDEDFDNNPKSAGGTVTNKKFYDYEVVKYGDIYCESLPETAARIYIKGGKWANWHDTGQVTNWTLTAIEVGNYYIKFVKSGYKECLANDGRPIKVLATQPAHAACDMKEIKPTVEFDWSPPSPTVNELVTFDATDSKSGTGANITSYTWYCDDVKFGKNDIKATKTFSEGSYRIKLKVTNSYGYAEEKVKVLTVKKPVCPSSTASFVRSPTNPKVGEEVTFTSNSTSTGATLVSWIWDFDDRTTGSGRTVKHRFTTKKVFHVKLTVKNDCCTNTVGKDSVTIPIAVEVATGNIKCYCTSAEYCGRSGEVYVDGKKVDVTKGSGYTYIKNQTLGAHTVKYNLLDVMECSGSVTVTADKDAIYQGVLALSERIKSKFSYDPTNYYYKKVKVTKIVDGDSIFTDFTDSFPKPPLFPDGQQVRIAGYDSPDGATARANAKKKLTELIPVGSPVTLKIWPPVPLGKLNRVLAGAFKGDVDIAAEMLKSCLVNESKYKGKDNFPWVDWIDYGRLWKDPVGKECLMNPDVKPLIVDIDTTRKTFKINNRWFTLDFIVKYEDEYGVQKGAETKKQVDGRKVSTHIAYAMGAYAIKLFACIEKCEKEGNWIFVDVGYVAAAPPTKKTVTFKSVPAGAPVTVVKKESARLVRVLKRVRNI